MATANSTPAPAVPCGAPTTPAADRLHGQMAQAYCLSDALKWLAGTLEDKHGTGPAFILEGLADKAAALARSLEDMRGDMPGGAA